MPKNETNNKTWRRKDIKTMDDLCVVSVLIAGGLYSWVNQAMLHTDSFVLQTVITLLLAYVFVFAFLFVKGSKK